MEAHYLAEPGYPYNITDGLNTMYPDSVPKFPSHPYKQSEENNNLQPLKPLPISSLYSPASPPPSVTSISSPPPLTPDSSSSVSSPGSDDGIRTPPPEGGKEDWKAMTDTTQPQ